MGNAAGSDPVAFAAVGFRLSLSGPTHAQGVRTGVSRLSHQNGWGGGRTSGRGFDSRRAMPRSEGATRLNARQTHAEPEVEGYRSQGRSCGFDSRRRAQTCPLCSAAERRASNPECGRSSRPGGSKASSLARRPQVAFLKQPHRVRLPGGAPSHRGRSAARVPACHAGDGGASPLRETIGWMARVG